MIFVSGKFFEMAARSEKGHVGLGYSHKRLIEAGIGSSIFSKKSNPTFIMTKQIDSNRPLQLLAFLNS